MLDISSLEKAFSQLETSYQYSVSNMAQEDAQLFHQFRMACIQAFEFCYERAAKLIVRALDEMGSAGKSVDHMTTYELFRSAFEAGLIEDPNQWLSYRAMRNITSHTYDEAEAHKVYEVLPAFMKDVSCLITRLREMA